MISQKYLELGLNEEEITVLEFINNANMAYRRAELQEEFSLDNNSTKRIPNKLVKLNLIDAKRIGRMWYYAKKVVKV